MKRYALLLPLALVFSLGTADALAQSKKADKGDVPRADKGDRGGRDRGDRHRHRGGGVYLNIPGVYGDDSGYRRGCPRHMRWSHSRRRCVYDGRRERRDGY